jgi:hypothetical protein
MDKGSAPLDDHDSPGDTMELVIQRLYALSLKLEYCIGLVDESPEQAREGLDAAVSELGKEIDRLRRHMRRLPSTR